MLTAGVYAFETNTLSHTGVLCMTEIILTVYFYMPKESERRPMQQFQYIVAK